MNRVIFLSHDPEHTRRLGERIGSLLTTGMILALTGTLGGGKTAFVKGLARGLGLPPEYAVTSPTYGLMRDYPCHPPLVHADLYRLSGGVDAEEIGFYEILDGRSVVAVEWADRLEKDVLGDRLDIGFQVLGDGARRLTLAAVGPEPSALLDELGNSDDIHRRTIIETSEQEWQWA